MKREPKYILGTLLYQLIKELPADSSLLPLLGRTESTTTIGGLEELITAVSKDKRVYLLVDALDESDEESLGYILPPLKRLAHIGRLLVTSRDISPISRSFEDAQSIVVGSTDVQDDIRKFVDRRINSPTPEESPLNVRDATLRKAVADTLVKDAHGMYGKFSDVDRSLD